MDHHELIYLLDEVDDERARARFRESIYISLILWCLALVLLRYVPHYIRQPQPLPYRDQKQYTITELPPAPKKFARPRPTPNIAERPQESQSPRPSEAIAAPKAGQPAPAAQPAPPQPQPQQQQQPAPQQQAKTQPPPPMQPQHAQPSPLPDMPKPSATKPNFSSQNMSAGEQIRQAARNAARPGSGGNYGNGPESNGGNQMGTQILSDTQGVDFSKYLERLLHDIKRNWLPLLPPETQSPLFKKGITGIRFTIGRDGTISGMTLDYSTHDTAINRSAWGSIKSLGQAQPLPNEFHGPNLELRIEFQVNKDIETR